MGAMLNAANTYYSIQGEYKSAQYQNDQIAQTTEQQVGIMNTNTSRTIAKQKVGYMKSGVEMVGSAADVVYDTHATNEKDVTAMVNDANQMQKNNVRQAKTAARGHLLSGIMNGVSPTGGLGGAGGGNASAGAMASGGSFTGMNGTTPTWDVSGAAYSGGNVNMSAGSYMG